MSSFALNFDKICFIKITFLFLHIILSERFNFLFNLNCKCLEFQKKFFKNSRIDTEMNALKDTILISFFFIPKIMFIMKSYLGFLNFSIKIFIEEVNLIQITHLKV